MKTITLDEVQYELPQHWNEMDLKSLYAVVTSLHQNITWQERRVRIFMGCINAGVSRPVAGGGYVLKTKLGRHAITAQQVLEYTQDLSFLTTTDSNGVELLNCGLTIAPFKYMPCACYNKILLPEDRLTNITLEQFTLATLFLHNMNDISSHKNPRKWLNYFVGTLCFSTRSTETFNSYFIDDYAARAAKSGELHKETIALFFRGCLNYLRQKFPRVFSGVDTADNADRSKQYAQLLHALSGGDVTKNEQLNRSNLYDVLHSLEISIQQQEEMKREMDNMKKKIGKK
jgi:hypothetical protein